MNSLQQYGLSELAVREYKPGEYKAYYEELCDFMAERDKICARQDIGWFKDWCHNRDLILQRIGMFLNHYVMPEYAEMEPEDREYHNKCIKLCYQNMRYYMPRYDLQDKQMTKDSPLPHHDAPPEEPIAAESEFAEPEPTESKPAGNPKPRKKRRPRRKWN